MTTQTVRYTKQQIKEFKILSILVMLFVIFLTFEFTRTLFPLRITKEVVITETVSQVIEVPMIDESISYRTLARPAGVDGSFKSYMDYGAITAAGSAQKAMQRLAITSAEGFRLINGKYLVAMGSGYAKFIGQEFRITLSTGKILWVVIGEFKSDRHTDPSHRFIKSNGNIIEFIVDTKKLSDLSIYHGNVAYSGLVGSVAKIEEVIYERN